jgi:hypothetical protein
MMSSLIGSSPVRIPVPARIMGSVVGVEQQNPH